MEEKDDKSEGQIFLQLIYAASIVGGFLFFLQLMLIGIFAIALSIFPQN